jgi:cell division protein FtsZ
MIDFKLDGPCGSKGKTRLRIVGIGQAGIAALDHILLQGPADFDLCALDCDQLTLDASLVRDKVLLGRELTRGLGCGGDIELARDVVEADAEIWGGAGKHCDYVIIVAGLGGAIGTTLAPELVKRAQREEAKAIVLAHLPLRFEGRHRRDRAEKALSKLRATADAVLVLSGERLLAMPEAERNFRHSFQHINRAAGQAVEALSQILCKSGLIQLSFADIRSLYGRYSGTEVLENCWSATAEITASEGLDILVDQLLTHPLLPDDAWELADHALVCVSGGRDTSLTDVQEVLIELQGRLPEGFPIATGATLEEHLGGRLRLSLLLAATRTPAAASKPLPSETPAFHVLPPPEKDQGPSPAPPELLADTVPLPVLPLVTDPVASMPAGFIPKKPAKVAKPLAAAALAVPTPPCQTQKIKLPNYYKQNLAPVDHDQEAKGRAAAGAHPPASLPADEPATACAAPSSASVDHSPPPPAQPNKAGKRDRKGKFHAKQEELPFDAAAADRGRFDKAEETIHNGENLDLPTFRRRRLEIRL